MPTDKKISELPVASSITASDISVLVDAGTDYQYTFTLLLQFLEANLATGAKISFGTTLPQNTSGSNGDVFVNTAAGSFAQKVSGAWSVVYTLPAANAADGTLLYGAGLPGSSTGKNTDSYINTLTGIFYQKSSGAWLQVFSMATGPQGPQGVAGTNGTNGTNGNTILFGTIDPSNSSTGIDGNFYINTSTYTLFGPKTSGVWGDGVSIIGAGVPAGGTAGQILVKANSGDFNTGWEDNSFANLSGMPGDNANLSAALAGKQYTLGFTPENTANKNQPNGYAGLDSGGKVASAQLPSYVDDVLEFANFAALPSTGETGKIYVTLDTNKEYRWSGSTYIQLVASPGSTDAVPEGSVNLYFTAARVLGTILSGISFGTVSAVSATDTILQGFGKLQAQISNIINSYVPYTGATTNLNLGANNYLATGGITINSSTNNIGVVNGTVYTAQVFDGFEAHNGSSVIYGKLYSDKIRFSDGTNTLQLATPLYPINSNKTITLPNNTGTVALALVPTAVKNSSYIAVVNDFIPVDTTSANITITLPSAPVNYSLVGVKHVIQGGTNTVTITTGGSDVYNKSGGGTLLTLSLLNQGVLLEYISGIWYIISDDLPLAALDNRYLPDGIISGLGLSISGSNVLTAAGSWRIGGIIYSTSSTTTLALDAQDATLSRYDMVYADSSGLHIVSGALSATPVFPAAPDNTIDVGTVLITPTSVTTAPPPTTGYVKTTTNQTIGGTKTFNSSPVVPTAVNTNQAINLGQVRTLAAYKPSYNFYQSTL